jgi:hypothetical protein
MNEVVQVLDQKALCLVAAPGAVGDETVGLQIVGEHFSKNGIVLDDQDFHTRRGYAGRSATIGSF